MSLRAFPSSWPRRLHRPPEARLDLQEFLLVGAQRQARARRPLPSAPGGRVQVGAGKRPPHLVALVQGRGRCHSSGRCPHLLLPSPPPQDWPWHLALLPRTFCVCLLFPSKWGPGRGGLGGSTLPRTAEQWELLRTKEKELALEGNGGPPARAPSGGKLGVKLQTSLARSAGCRRAIPTLKLGGRAPGLLISSSRAH